MGGRSSAGVILRLLDILGWGCKEVLPPPCPGAGVGPCQDDTLAEDAELYRRDPSCPRCGSAPRREGRRGAHARPRDLRPRADVAKLEGIVIDWPAGNEVYELLLTVPGIGPETAATLVMSVDISMFRGHDELASCYGAATADTRSSTSVRSTSPQRGGTSSSRIRWHSAATPSFARRAGSEGAATSARRGGWGATRR